MGGVVAGSPVSAGNTNPAFIDANGDDVTIGRLGLQNPLAESGAYVDNIQKEHNANSSYTGMPLNSAKDVIPAWTNNDVGASSDQLKTRVDLLTAKFNASTGHKHTGAAGDAPPVSSVDLSNVVLQGRYIQGILLVAVTGTSTNVSSQFNIEIPSTNDSTAGVVVNAPYNVVVLKNTNGDQFEDGSGNKVYGRLTESSGVWTLSYYVMISGVQTAYSFSASSVDIYFQKLFNPIVDAPVYSELVAIPSTNATSDVVDATETQKGIVLLSNVVATPVGSTNVKGTALNRVAKEDHAHQGVHGIFKTGDTNVYGDIELSPGLNTTIVRSGNKFTIDANGGVGYQEVPSGPVNGVNTVFGPLSQLPSSAESVLVFIDGLPVDKSKYSVSSYTITFGGGFQPVSGQDVYAFYLSAGIPAIPPTPTGTLQTEFRTITSLEATNKIVVLANTPASAGIVLVDIIGGTSQEFLVDYTIVSNEFRWNGYALDGLLSSGDRLRFHYIT